MNSYVNSTIRDLSSHHRCYAVGRANTRRTPWIQYSNIVMNFVLHLVAVATNTDN